jgi:DNA polymerase I-like protein with 3'-5' exonuclease and polymerase domains
MTQDAASPFGGIDFSSLMDQIGTEAERLTEKAHRPGELEPHPWMSECQFLLLTSLDEVKTLIDECLTKPYVCLDLETTGLDTRILDPVEGRTCSSLVGYCISPDGVRGYYLPVGHVEEGAPFNLPARAVAHEIKRLCDGLPDGKGPAIIFHNAMYDLEMLHGLNVGIDLDSPSRWHDTLILDYLRDSSQKRRGLKMLSATHLNMEMFELDQLFPPTTKERNFGRLDPSGLNTLRYAGSDAICTYRLYEFLEPYSKEQATIYMIEKGCVPATRWMMRNRVKLHLPYLRRLRAEILEYTDLAVEHIYDSMAVTMSPFLRDLRLTHEATLGAKNLGETLHLFRQLSDKEALRQMFDVKSPQQLGKMLALLSDNSSLTGFDVQLVRTEKSGQVKTDNDTLDALLSSYGARFDFLQKIGVFRTLQKTEGTYLRPLLHNHYEGDGTVKFDFNQFGTDTGRFSSDGGRVDQGSSGVNIQSMPACYKEVKKVYTKVIEERPAWPLDQPLATLDDLDKEWGRAVKEQGFLRLLREGQFVEDLYTGQQHCLRRSCDDCPLKADCKRSEPRQGRWLSMEAGLRAAMIADTEDDILVAIDQSGVELRVTANISKEPRWIQEFVTGSGDLHSLTATLVWGEGIRNDPVMFKLRRQQSKTANFLILYGGGPSRLSVDMGISILEARDFHRTFLDQLPRLRQWFSQVHASARKLEYVTTDLGRRVRLPDINHEDGKFRSKAERNAVNSIIQGTATGDLTKYCMARIYKELKARGWLDFCKLKVCVHDELVFQMRKAKMEELIPFVLGIMTEMGDKRGWPVPLACDVELGASWWVIYNWAEFTKDVDGKDPTKFKDPVPPELTGYLGQWKPGMWYLDPATRSAVFPKGRIGEEGSPPAEDHVVVLSAGPLPDKGGSGPAALTDPADLEAASAVVPLNNLAAETANEGETVVGLSQQLAVPTDHPAYVLRVPAGLDSLRRANHLRRLAVAIGYLKGAPATSKREETHRLVLLDDQTETALLGTGKEVILINPQDLGLILLYDGLL